MFPLQNIINNIVIKNNNVKYNASKFNLFSSLIKTFSACENI
jgi:hypothetical protein